jgi:hypothetical protein
MVADIKHTLPFPIAKREFQRFFQHRNKLCLTKTLIPMKKFLLLVTVLFAVFQSAKADVPVSLYIFNQSVLSYTPITGGTVLIDGTSAMDSWVSSAITIPSFTFGGVAYTTAYVTSNGQVTLGGSAPSTVTYTGISTGVGTGAQICICPMSADLNRATTTSSSEIRWETVGNEVVFQWTQICRYAQTESFDFQARLNTSTGLLTFVYKLNSGPGSGTTYQPQVGIRTSATDYKNRLVSTGTEDWSTSLPGTVNTDVCRFTSASPAKNFVTGLTYTYTPPAPCVTPPAQPTVLNLTPGVYFINGSFTAASGTDKYLVVRSTSSSLSADPVNGTVYSAGNALGGGVVDYYGSLTSWSSTGLSASTLYYFFVFSANDLCTGGPFYRTTSPLSGSASTNALMTYYWVATTGTASWATAASWNPARNTPDPTDILLFNQGGSSTATDVPTQTVGRMRVTNNTVINLQAAATSTLTIASDGSATDELFVEGGSTLMSNGTAAALTITYSGTGSTGSIAGTVEVTSATGSTTANTFNFTGGTTPVTTVTGTLANGQSGGTGVPVITGTAATLVFTSTGIYQHKFTTSAGSIPTATWSTGSTVQILGYTTNTSNPGTIAQTFSNFTWNCINQGTTNISLGGNLPTAVNGTFTLASTGASGSLRLGASTTNTLVVGNYTQTGGILDLSSGTGSGTIKVAGIFNQSAGTLTESGTGTANTIEFNGTSNQAVTFGGTLSNTLSYRINNNAGITLTGTMAVTTGASLIISSTAATPISGGTLTYSGTTTLVYNSTTGNQTATANEFPGTGGPTNLTINAPGYIVSIPFDRTITGTGTLTMTAGDINMGSYTMTLGTGVAAMGTLTYTAGGIIGNFKRWVSVATGSKDYPVGVPFNARKAAINFTVAPSAGGTITASFIPTNPGTAGLPLTQGSITVNTAGTAGYWSIVPGDGLTGGTYTGTFTATNFPGVLSYANLVLLKRVDGGPGWILDGTHVTTTGSNAAPVLSRTGMIGLGQFGVGGDAATNPLSGTNIYSVASGEWSNGATWSTGSVPTVSDYVTISPGHTITMSAKTTYSCYNLTIATTGTFTNTAGDLSVGGTLTNNGTFNSNGGTVAITGGSGTGITNAATTGNFNVSAGTVTVGPAGGGKTTFTNNGIFTVSANGVMNINGNYYGASGSVFNQSGGNINIDGNAAGVAGNSASTYLMYLAAAVNWTGGTLTIVDPSAATSTNHSIYYTTSTSSEVSTNHTLRFGDGVSSDAGGSANGFYTNIYVSSAKLNFGNVIVNGPGTGTASATNRMWVPVTYTTGIRGNLTINNNGESNATVGFYLGGNLTVNTGGILTNTSTIYLAMPQGTSSVVNPNPQQIANYGTIRNSATTPTASFASLSINNNSTGGVTIANGQLSISGTLTMTSGIINTTLTNGLILGTLTAAGTLSGGSSTAYFNGPFARTFAASRTATGTYTVATLYPVGKGTTYMPLYIDPSTSSGGAVLMTGEAFLENAGFAGPGVYSMSQHSWQALNYLSSADFLGAYIKFGDAGIASTNQIVQSFAADGEYTAIPVATVYTAGTPNTLNTGSQLNAANYYGYFAYGNIVNCVAPTAQPTDFAAGYKTTTTFVGSWTAASPAPSHYLVVRYPGGTGTITSPVDFTNYSVGASLGLGTVRYAGINTWFAESGLTAGLTYDYYIYSYNNSGCYGPVYLTTSPLTGSVTTCSVAVGAPGTPVGSSVTNSGFVATWNASSTSDVYYTLDVSTTSGFTSWVPGYHDLNVGTDQFYPITGLAGNTTYYVRVRAIENSTSCYSSYSGTLTQATDCDPIVILPTSQDFAGSTFPPSCWRRYSGLLENPSILTTTTSGWIQDDWRNVTSPVNKAARVNIYSTTCKYWLVTPAIDLGSGTTTYQLAFDLSLVDYGTSNPITSDPNGPTGIDDKFAVVISTDGGNTWTSANTLRLWDNAGSEYVYNSIDYLGEHVTISLFGYTGVIKIAFYGESTVSNADNDLMVDNVTFEVPPLCPFPRNQATSNITKSTADLNWTAGSTETTWEVLYGPSGFDPQTAGTLITGITDHPYTLNPPLTPLTSYDWYVRANCGGSSGVSLWTGPKSFVTLCEYDPITSTTPGSRCGTGTVQLAATSTGGTMYWFANQLGGSPLGTGSPFTTPVISASTFFYVGTTSGGGTTGSVGPLNNSIGAGGYVNYEYYEVFDVLASSVTIDGVFVYPNTSGDVKLRIANSANTTITTITYPVSTPSVKTYIPIGVSLSAGTGYRIGYSSSLGGVSLYRNTAGATHPYTLTNVISITGNTFSGYPQYFYYCYDWQVSTACTSPRTKVLATVLPPPDLSLSAGRTTCNNGIVPISVTSNIGDFDTYTWTPVTDLYTDPGCTVPYVALTNATTVYAKSSTAGSLTYTCLATNNTSGCTNMAQTTITVMPGDASISASPSTICISGTAMLSLSPSTGWGDATFQWQSATDGFSFTDIPDATSQTYTTPTLSSTTYYRLLIRTSGNELCASPTTMVDVANVSLTSTTPGSRCGTGTVTLEATSVDVIKWYADSLGGTPLGEGSPWQTPVISTTTKFWVAAESSSGTSSAYVGMIPTIFGTSGVGAPLYGLYFDALSAFTLSSVAVYPISTVDNTPGTVTISVINSSGSVLNQAVVNVIGHIQSAGLIPETVSLNFNIAPANGLRLVMTSFSGISGMMFQPSSQSPYPYPYTIPGIVSITSGTYGGVVHSDLYYYFYNWMIGGGCATPRVAVTATVTPAPDITPSASPLAICPAGSSDLAVISPDLDYQYVWTPGNLYGATQTVSPTATTQYTVTANDPISGCSNMGSVTVTVNPAPSDVIVVPPTAQVGSGVQQLIAYGGLIGTTINEGFETFPSGYFAASGSAITPAASTTYYSEGVQSVRITHLASPATTTSSTNNSYELQSNIDMTGCSSATLTFSHICALEGSSNTYDAGIVEYSTDGGANWTIFPTSSYVGSATLITSMYPGPYSVSGVIFSTKSYPDWVTQFSSSSATPGTGPATSLWKTETINIPAEAYSSQFRIRFQIINDGSVVYYGWMIDNINLTVVGSTGITWSPLTSLYTNALGTIPYMGETTNSVYANPSAPITYTATATSSLGCTSSGTCVFLSSDKLLHLHNLYLEGYYAGEGAMNQSYNCEGLQFQPDTADLITVELHNSTTYGTIEYSTTAALQTSGSATLSTPAIHNGSYYVTVKNRSTVETTTANPVSFAGTVINYSFNPQSQAYGDNMAVFIDGTAAFFTGDENQDGLVDGTDLSDVGNLADYAECGYLPQDLNGDGLIDGSDLSLCGNNADYAIGIVLP